MDKKEKSLPSTSINWYPGHMVKAQNDIKAVIKLIDIVVEVLDASGELRDMDSILDDLASKWDTLSRAQKNALAQTVGGVRQYNNLISLMDNYDAFQGFAQGAADSEGFLNKQNTVYLESWYAAMDQLEASWEKIYSILIILVVN